MKTMLATLLLTTPVAASDLCEDMTAAHQAVDALVKKHIQTVDKCVAHKQSIEAELIALRSELDFWTDVQGTTGDYFAAIADVEIARLNQQISDAEYRLESAAYLVGLARQLLVDSGKQWLLSQAAMRAACGYWQPADPVLSMPVPDPMFAN